MNRLRGTIAILIIGAVVGACGSGGGPGVTSGPGSTKDTGTGSNTGNGNGGATAGPAEGSGATVRLVNVWAEAAALGPIVKLRVSTSGPEQVLLTAEPGKVTEFVVVPNAQFGDGPARLEVVEEGSDNAIGTGTLAAGDRVTVIVHGEERSGETTISMRAEPIWEKGEPYYGLPWPEAPAGGGVINVLTGPLLALQGSFTIAVRTDTGECLTDPTFNQPSTGGFGGTGSHYLTLATGGKVTLHIKAGAASSACGTEIDPDIGIAAIDTTGGVRWGIIPWGKSNELTVLTLDMGTG